MSRRLVTLTLDTLADLPRPCRGCVFWELDPVAARDAREAGDPGLEKEAWLSQTLLEWGSCGKLAYVGTAPAGYVMYAPATYLPRASAFPTAPVSADAALLTTIHVVPGYAGSGLGRMLVQGAARDLARRGIRAIEVFADARPGEPDETRLTDGRCVAPADFILALGFKTVRSHPRYPRLRLEIRSGQSLQSDVEYALDTLLDTITMSGPRMPGAGTVPTTIPISAPVLGTERVVDQRNCPAVGPSSHAREPHCPAVDPRQASVAASSERRVETSIEPVDTSDSTG